MTTRFIGVKEFRQNMTSLSAQARRRKERLILLCNNEPIFELRPLSKQDATLEALTKDLREAEEDVRRGRTFTQGQVEKRFGLR